MTQSPEVLNAQEGDGVVLNCSYTDAAFYSLQWFRQDPGKGLTFLLFIQSAQKEQTSGRIKASLDKSAKHGALYIAASEPSDSATYLCAVRHSAQQAHVTNTQTLQLRLHPRILS